MIIRTASWALHATAVMGPDSCQYGELTSVGLRLDMRVQRQGARTMEWRYTAMPIDEFSLLYQLWEAHPESIDATWMDPDGTWKTGSWHMMAPTIGRRETFYVYEVSLIFHTVTYTGNGLPITSGATPSIYEGWSNENQPPTARISYSAAIIGDPEIVVTLDGSRSADVDGVIVGYSWLDNTEAFTSLPEYPYFDSPHEAGTVTTQFRYPYAADMPNPVITLEVTDNAGLVGSATITIDIATLVLQSATFGKRFVVVANGDVYISRDGGFTFQAIPGISGATVVCGAGGTIVIGCSDGSIYSCPNDAPERLTQVYTFEDSVTAIACAWQAPSNVIAVAANGQVALSQTGGTAFGDAGTVGTSLYGAAYNTAVPNEAGVAGGEVRYTRNGVLWESDAAGLPASTWYALQRTGRLRYVAGEAGLFAATGAAWVAVPDMALPLRAVSIPGGTDANIILVGADDGTLWCIQETTILRTLAHTSAIYAFARDPDLDALVLIGTGSGLYKTLNQLESIGLMAFDGQDVPSVDVMRDGGMGIAELVVCGFGGLGIGGVWYYALAAGWLYRSAGLPESWEWYHVTADPYDKGRWAVAGNTGGYAPYTLEYRDGRVYAAQASLSPIWMTTDYGLSWQEVPLYTESHIGHADSYLSASEWETFHITSLAFDRTAARKLFVFGTGKLTGTDVGTHGFQWSGTDALHGRVFIGGTAQYLLLSSGAGRDDSDIWTIVSGEGGPDGGTVFIATCPGGFYRQIATNLLDATSSYVVNRNPGQIQLAVNGPTAMERRPLFNAFEVLVAVRSNYEQAVNIYRTPHYQATGLAYRQTVSRQSGENDWPAGDWSSNEVSLTWAIDGAYLGYGMGLVWIPDPSESSDTTLYAPETYFSRVRCDRQWRKAVAALAPKDRMIHARYWDGTNTSWNILPYPHPDLPPLLGLEVLGL